MRGLTLVLLLAAAAGAQALGKVHHHKCHYAMCSPKGWDRVFATKGGNVIDPAKPQWAQKALNTVVVQTTAAMITEGILPRGSYVKQVKALKGCYDSIVPGSLRGKQYAGEYGFVYDIVYKVPGVKAKVWAHVYATSYNRRHFPWFELIEAYVW